MWPIVTSGKVQKADVPEQYREGVERGGGWRARHPALIAHDAAFVQTASYDLVLRRIMRFYQDLARRLLTEEVLRSVEAFRDQIVNNAKAGHAPPPLWIVQQFAVMLYLEIFRNFPFLTAELSRPSL